MYRLVILSIVIDTALHATRCCKKTSDLQDTFLNSEEYKECLQVNMDPALCEHDLCLAKKMGFTTDDNKLDKKKFEEVMNKDFGSETDLMKDIKSKCFTGDLVKYGPPEFCEFIKMKFCISSQMSNHCPEWNDNETCKEFKGLVLECVKTIF